MSALILVVIMVLIAAGGSAAQILGKDTGQGFLRAVVKVMTPFEFSIDAGNSCSAVLLNQQGYLLTSFHCVGYPNDGTRDRELDRAGLKPGDLYNRQGTSVIAVTNDLRYLPVPAYTSRVIVADPDLDLAVLKITGYLQNSKQPLPQTLPLVPLPLADSDKVTPTNEINLLAYSSTDGGLVAAIPGQISGILDEDQDGATDWLQAEVATNHGFSGGAAINAQDELIGIPTSWQIGQSGHRVYRLRPSNLAVTLIQRAIKVGESVSGIGGATTASAPALPPEQNIGKLTFSRKFGDENLTDFPTNPDAVHAAVPYQQMRDGMHWGYAWQLDDRIITGESDLKWLYGPSGVLDLSLVNKTGLADGIYGLQILLSDRVISEGRFIVGEPKFKSAPQKPVLDHANSGVTITGNIIDHSTRKPIQGAAIAFLLLGKTVRDFDNDNSKGRVNSVHAFGVTNANGVFTSNTPLERGQIYGVIVSVRGYERIAADNVLEILATEPDIVELQTIEMDRQ